MDEEEKLIEGIWQKAAEKEQNIVILRGMERRKERNMLLMAGEFLGGMGIKGLFYGMTDVVAVAMVFTICVFAGVYIYLGYDVQYTYSMVFIFSPTLYTSIFGLSYVKEMQLNTINVQMSCRYTFFHVLIFRMLLNSGLAVVFNMLYICTLNSRFDMNLAKALALSFSSLMFFSVLLLKSLKCMHKLWGFTGMNAIWFGVNLMAFHGMKARYMRILERIPVSVLTAAAIVFAAFYYMELKKVIRMRHRRRYSNA